MSAVINFGNVALMSDPIFGALVFADPGEWVPFEEGSHSEREWVRGEVVGHPLYQCLSEFARDVIEGRKEVLEKGG
jgi:hypothetical protein